VALAVAALQMAAYLVTPTIADPHAVVGLGMLAPGHVFLVPGLRQPTFVGVLDGLSISLAVLVATIGLAGLAVSRQGRDAPLVVRAVARAFALGSALLLAVSIADYFSLQTFFIALMTMCFGMAAVNPEG